MTKAIEPRSPFIVTGTGRSGTSTVGRVLHTLLNVSMGEEHVKADHANPDGYWEDLDFWNLNRAFIRSMIDFNTFFLGVQNVITKRENDHKVWGFKDTKLCYFLGLYLSYLNDPKIIVCERPKHLVVNSLARVWNQDKKIGEQFYDGRILCLDRLLQGRDHLVIRFGKERKSDDEIVDEIKSKWGYVWDILKK